MLKHKFYGGASSDSKPDSAKQDKNVTIKITSPPDIESIEPTENRFDSYNKGRLIMDNDKQDPTVMFKDGVRKVDYVLVIEDVKKTPRSQAEETETTTLIADQDEEINRLRKKTRLDVWRPFIVMSVVV